MKQEKLMRALNDVGDDLLHMAEHRRFSNPWRKWIATAACAVLVISLTTLALPYFPMGCGSSTEAPSEEAASAPETPGVSMEEAVEETVEETAPEENVGTPEDAPVENPMEEPESAEPEFGEGNRVPDDVTQITFCSTLYYLPDMGNPLTKKPGAAGDYIGDITASEDARLVGCAVYAVEGSTWFSNHAVDGQAVPQDIYVEGPDGWLFGSTSNEKTVSRYTAVDVQNAVDRGDSQWIIETFVEPVEAHVVDLMQGGAVADSETLNGLFLASLQLNTGNAVDWPWLQENETLLVHPEDVEQRLERFLDDFDYDPAETEAYDPATGVLRFTAEECGREAEGLYLKRASVEGNRVWLWVGLPETEDLYDEKMYELRFDEDSWRYINILTPG